MKSLINKTLLGIGIIGLTAGLAQAKEFKQYLEVNTGLNYGSVELKANGQKVEDLAKIHQLTNFNIGYGLDFGRFAFGIRGGLNSVDNSIKASDLADYEANDFGLSTTTNNIELKPKETYSLMAVGNYNIINFTRYKAGLIAGLGLAVQHINTSSIWINSDFLKDPSMGTSVETETLKKKQTDYIPTLAFMIGIKQEFFINSNVAIGAEINYVSLGSPDYKFKDLDSSPKLELQSNGMLNFNLGLKVYL